MDILVLKDFVPYQLAIASHAVIELFGRAYERLFGLSIPEWRLLAILAEHGQLSQAQIFRLTHLERSVVSRAARNLVDRRLLMRLPPAEGSRAERLQLTDTGRVLYRAVVPAALKFEKELLRGFSEAEIRRLSLALAKLESAAERITAQAD